MFDPRNNKSIARKTGQKAGFFLALAIFFTVLNSVSYYFSGTSRRGLIFSAVAAILLLTVFTINRRHKQWVF